MKNILFTLLATLLISVTGYSQKLYSATEIGKDSVFLYEEAIYNVDKLTDSTARISYYDFNFQSKTVEVSDSLIGILVGTERLIATLDSTRAINVRFISRVDSIADSSAVIIYNRPKAPNREIQISENPSDFLTRVNAL